MFSVNKLKGETSVQITHTNQTTINEAFIVILKKETKYEIQTDKSNITVAENALVERMWNSRVRTGIFYGWE